MKITVFTALLSLTAFAAAMPQLEARADCGDGSAAYTRSTNSPCNTFDHTYCGCDRTGIVACTGGYWREIKNCGDDPHFQCRGTSNGASCKSV
ncbi:hypothetical protein EK21DRAFT_118775 [Setomelanomma holmii]|uniref:Uncharacterized protein n=1 Tax=Setomelanomma holmii TaxID=210430 RepID=A0A9P4GWT9_9PLEO|nr:hypothetical protein EK21DRAFT_118775 [Setomelanomma holmii]